MPEHDVLIVCPKGGLPQWRRTIALSGSASKSVTLINYKRIKSLLAAPPASTRRSVRAKNNERARHGTPQRTWPIVIFDESHRLRNPYAQQSMACRHFAAAASFSIYMSATAGQSPHELSYLGRLLGHAAGCPTDTLADFRMLVRTLGIGRARGRWTNWSWEPNERDRRTMADLLYRGPNAIGLRRRPSDIAGWPEVQRELAPTELGRDERRLYEATWREFRREFGLAGGSTRRPTGWAADLRFRQKASLLRVAGTVAFAEDLLSAREQVAISVAYLETGSMLEEALRGRGWSVSEINGNRSGDENEAARLAFQTGKSEVVIFTVTESISLHRGEMAGGDRSRSLVVHDMRHSAIQLQQLEGRCHRDGQRAVIYYAFAEDTVEERIAATVVGRMVAMDGMMGDDASFTEAIARVFEDAATARDG